MCHNQTTILKRFLAIILLSSQFLTNCINPDVPNIRANRSPSSLNFSSIAIREEKNIPLPTSSSLDPLTSEQALTSSQVNPRRHSVISHALTADPNRSIIVSPQGHSMIGKTRYRLLKKGTNTNKHSYVQNKTFNQQAEAIPLAKPSHPAIKAQLDKLRITAKGGYPVNLFKVEGHWIATLEEKQGCLDRTLDLTIRVAPGFSLTDLFNHQQDWHQRYVQVVFPEKSPHNQGYLCIGMTGIVGGMKGQQKSKCPYPEDQRRWDPQLGKYVCPGKDKHDRNGNPNPIPSGNSATASTTSTRSADTSTTPPSTTSDPTSDPLAFLRRPKESEKERQERLHHESQEEALAAYKRILDYQEKIKSDLIEHNQSIYKQIKETVKELRSKYKQASKWVIVIENLQELEVFQKDLAIATKQVEQLRDNLKIVEGKHRGITRAQIELYRVHNQLEGEDIYFEPISALSRLYSLQTPLEKLKEWFVFLDRIEKSIQQEADMLYKLSKLHHDGPDNHESIDKVIAKAQEIKAQLKSSRKNIKCYGAHSGEKEEKKYTPNKEQLEIQISSIKATEEKLDQIITRFKRRKETVKPSFKKVVEYAAYQAIAHFQTKGTDLSKLVNYPVESYEVEVRPQQGKENVAYGELEGVFLDNETVSIEKFLELMEVIVVVQGRDRQTTRLNVSLEHSEPLKLSTIDVVTYSAFINQLNNRLETDIEQFNQLVKEGTNAKAIVEEGNKFKTKLQEAIQRLRSYPTKQDKKEALSYLTNLEKEVEEKVKEEAHALFVQAINEEIDQAGARTGELAKAGSNPEATIEEATKFKRKLEELIRRVQSYTYKRDQVVENLRGIIKEVEQIISEQGEEIGTSKLEAIKEKEHNSYLKEVISQVSEAVEHIEADLIKIKSGDI